MTAPTPLPDVAVLCNLFKYEDGKLIRRVTVSNNAKAGSVVGVTDHKGYILVKIQRKMYKAHRIIWKMHHGVDPGPQLDHINEDPSDNRIENLRNISRGHNKRRSAVGNVRKRTNGRYEARAGLRGGSRHLGVYDTKGEAQQAIYDYCDDNEIRYD